jgi:hypothetical protein
MQLSFPSTFPYSQALTNITCAGSGREIPDSQELIRAVASQNVTCATHVASVHSSHPWTRTPATQAPSVHPDTPQSTPRLVRVVRSSRLEVCT